MPYTWYGSNRSLLADTGHGQVFQNKSCKRFVQLFAIAVWKETSCQRKQPSSTRFQMKIHRLPKRKNYRPMNYLSQPFRRPYNVQITKIDDIPMVPRFSESIIILITNWQQHVKIVVDNKEIGSVSYLIVLQFSDVFGLENWRKVKERYFLTRPIWKFKNSVLKFHYAYRINLKMAALNGGI